MSDLVVGAAAYRDLIRRYHRKGLEGKCPYCQEQWPCTIYREVVDQEAQ